MQEIDAGIFLPLLVGRQPASVFGKGPLPKAVFLELVTMSAERRVTFVKVHTTSLAEAVGCYRSSVNKALTELQEKEHIRWLKVNKRNQYQHRNHVTLRFDIAIITTLQELGQQHNLPFPRWVSRDLGRSTDVDLTVLLE